ncbi:MAG: methylaspartate mutase sigma subunit [Acidobacteriota bacterium]|jgi:methylaspartate mutase epsilon subunit|nr:methylaspartate mutase sigma subunit [Acidobacteriota bacterium]
MSSSPLARAQAHTILLGSIGGDSHSVGLNILRQALTMDGYRVRYLGTQNRVEDFFQHAALADAVMISSMDGHGRYYLRDFRELMQKYQAHKPLWYLGGNLHIGVAIGYEKHFREMGFDQVFVKFVDIEKVLATLKNDLRAVLPTADCPTLWEQPPSASGLLPGKVSDHKLEPTEFERQRREVLDQWRTGQGALSLEENAEYLGRQPSFPAIQARARSLRPPILVQPRSGVTRLPEQVKLFKTFKAAGARVLSYQVDSLTRNNNYAGAEEAIRESRLSGDATLNGFPVINHGVKGLRKVMAEIGLPLQTRHSTRDPRLLAEISYAGGVTSFEGGAVCYNIPYYRDYPLDESVRAWQYVDRLTGLFHERFGIALDREFFGTLTATLIPPCLAVAVNILEAVLALQQGVKCVSLGYAEQGNRVQDIAAVRALGQMARDVIGNLGFKDVQVSTVFHQYMAAFPRTHRRAEELIYNSAITAALSGATRVITKTAVESSRIPTVEDNVAALGLVMRGVSEARDLCVDEARVAEEYELIKREAGAILESVIFCGRGSIAEGVVTAFRKGYLDIPFSPSIHNRSEVSTARDLEGAVRLLSPGNLQLDKETLEFHRDKMAARRRAEGLSPAQDYFLIEKDVMRVPREQYESWPLCS